MNNIGFKINHTDIFISLRNQQNQNIESHNNIPENILTTVSDNINIKLSLLDRKINELDELFTQRNRPTFDTAEIEMCDHNIKQTTDEIGRKITNISSEIKKVVYTQDPEVATLLINLQQCHKLRLSKLVQKFRNLQATKRPATQRLIENENHNNQISDMYSDFAVSGNDDSSSLLQQNFEERQDDELQELVRMMNDLNSLFRDMSLLIYDQGTILDRIDTKIEMAVQEVERGNRELETANEHQSNQCFYTYIGALVIMIAICLLIMIYRKL